MSPVQGKAPDWDRVELALLSIEQLEVFLGKGGRIGRMLELEATKAKLEAKLELCLARLRALDPDWQAVMDHPELWKVPVGPVGVLSMPTVAELEQEEAMGKGEVAP